MDEARLRLIAVSHVMNEADVIEPFVRHTAAFVAGHVILDNGSSDRTLHILTELKREGIALVVFRNEAAFFAELIYNTMLYGYAAGALAPDWVLHLDADEFIDDRAAQGGVAAMLARVPAELPCVRIPMANYEAATETTRGEANVVRRLVRRQASPGETAKVFVRGGFPAARIAVACGNHAIALDGVTTQGLAQDAVRLAHYPIRSAWQLAAKVAVGRLKVLAAGPADAEVISHYTPQFELLRTRPEAWLETCAERDRRQADGVLVEDPIDYRGGALRHTGEPAGADGALARMLAAAERIAEAHGRRIGADERTQLAAMQEAMAFQRVL